MEEFWGWLLDDVNCGKVGLVNVLIIGIFDVVFVV